MKEVILNIPDNKFHFFMELIHNLGFVHIKEKGDSREEIISNLREGFTELKDYRAGKVKGTPVQDFINEL